MLSHVLAAILLVASLAPTGAVPDERRGERDQGFASSAHILELILEHERADPDGLYGFLLLMHLGA
ncbi:MAG TPA: hypothetical protein VGK32_10800 [Vicinamibacterales bacterium]